MSKIDSLLYKELIKRKRSSKEVLEPLLKEAGKTAQTLASILIKRKVIPEQEVLTILAKELKLACPDLKSMSIDKAVIERIPLKVAYYYKFMPVKIERNTLTVAVAYPLDIKIQDEIRMQLGLEIETSLARESDINQMLNRYYGLGAETLDRIISKAPEDKDSGIETLEESVEDIEKLAEDASVIKLVNQIILEAYKKRATDIHLEPYRGEVVLRYRIDGVLYDAKVPAQLKHFFNAIISRIKIMSNLNIVEHRLPQDGRAIVKTQETTLDLRVSTLPTPYGESVVIRILPTQMLMSLESLGLLKKDLELFEQLILKPHGIIFVTGPTGSGKTTTLYACLSRINTKERKIITIEDPIEYEMKGITQIQVMPQVGLDFARGLRSMLRHDPDVMMVGEVRDLETAEIAIRVALTGHLVFSTLHTNDAASGITRLLDIGVEPYLAASSVEAFIAQRLVRIICPECKEEDKNFLVQLKRQIAQDLHLESPERVRFFRGKGCEHCGFTGFYGRTAIYETLLVDDKIKELVLKRASASEIKKEAIRRGMRTLLLDGWQKIIDGVTTPEEVMKVTSSEDFIAPKSEKEQLINKGYSPAKAQAADERRAYSRLDKRFHIRYKIFNSKEDLLQHGYAPEYLSVTKNISAGGLLFVSHQAVPVGAIMELTIELPDAQGAVECLARVLRIKEVRVNEAYNIAACFLDITSAQRSKLDQYVKEKLKK
ncbi:ATPase, T2SS/T4P/T4SS family [Candidatus Omnitrophota bacterium]